MKIIKVTVISTNIYNIFLTRKINYADARVFGSESCYIDTHIGSVELYLRFCVFIYYYY